jgi:hypothetical protein
MPILKFINPQNRLIRPLKNIRELRERNEKRALFYNGKNIESKNVGEKEEEMSNQARK